MPDSEGPSYRDQEWLREQYIDQNQSSCEIAEEAGCSANTILKWLRRFDIERRSHSEAARVQHLDDLPSPRINEYGYEIVKTYHDNDRFQVAIHRLVAVAEYGFNAVSDKLVHHVNHIPWDNRPENLELMSQTDHSEYHGLEYNDGGPWRDEEKLRSAYSRGLEQEEIAEEFGCSVPTVQRWTYKFDIDTSEYEEEKPWKDKATFREAYRTHQISELADKWGCSETTVTNWAKRHGVKKSDFDNDGQSALADYPSS